MTEVSTQTNPNKSKRKTTTRKVARKSMSSTTKRNNITSNSNKNIQKKKFGLSLKFILFIIFVLSSASVGAFYVGYSAQGVIDVNELLSDSNTLVDKTESTVSNEQKPAPRKERPVLEPAIVETPKPVLTSTDEVSDTATTTQINNSEQSEIENDSTLEQKSSEELNSEDQSTTD